MTDTRSDAFLAGHKHAEDRYRPVIVDALNRVQGLSTWSWADLAQLEGLLSAALIDDDEDPQ